RRYETANGLMMDIQRHLSAEPVLARPPSQLYRFQKLVQRHKAAFAASSAFLGVLVLGIAVSTWQAVRATHAEKAQILFRQQAEESEQRALAAQKDEAKQRQAAEEARLQAEANRTRLAQTLDRLELQRTEDFFITDESSKALAHLAW